MSIALGGSGTAWADPVRQAYGLLRLGFVVAPVLFGLDKFFDVTVEWERYLAPWIDDLVPGSAETFMRGVGVIEIAAGLLVAFVPRIGAPVVAAWLGGIIVNLLTADPPRFYDIALRDVGLMIGALALTRLAWSPAVRAQTSADGQLGRSATPDGVRRPSVELDEAAMG